MAKRPGLYANIAAKKRRIKAGSGEKMRKKGAKGAPTSANFKRAAQQLGQDSGQKSSILKKNDGRFEKRRLQTGQPRQPWL